MRSSVISFKPTILTFEQGSDEWLQARLGLATASRFKDILATTKSGTPSKARDNYKAELVAERLTGRSPDRFNSADMAWGSETEELARLEYSLKTGNVVDEVGLYVHPDMAVAASPDGLVSTEGGIEIKNRRLANHIESLRTGEVPKEFIDQVHGCLWLAGRKWWDYVSFAPELPENAQLFIKRVMRDEVYIAGLQQKVREFLEEVDKDVKFVEGYKRGK